MTSARGGTRGGTRGRAAAVGLVVTLVLIAAAFVVPVLWNWQVWARFDPTGAIPPLHGLWDPQAAWGTVPAVLLAVAAVRWAATLAERLSWGRLLATAYAAGLVWLLALALTEGWEGVGHVLGHPQEYLGTARGVDDVPALLDGYVDRIPLDSEDNWPIHVAGHPPGMVLFFVALVKVGLGGDLAAGLVVTAIAATLPLAVMTTLRALDREAAARVAAPYLVLTPAAVFLAVSADAVMATVVAWGMACLALACRARHLRGVRRAWPLAVVAGLLLGSAVMMSYGLPLTGILAVAILWRGRGWWVLPVAATAALAVVLAFAALGFAWWEAYPVLVDRYWDGIASDRPGGYWLWGDLAALAVSAGPLVGAGLAATTAGWRSDRTTATLVAAAVAMVLVADLSQMSRAEVERIWLPFVPWLTLGCVFLPPRWHRPGLALQLTAALAVELLLYTSW